MQHKRVSELSNWETEAEERRQRRRRQGQRWQR